MLFKIRFSCAAAVLLLVCGCALPVMRAPLDDVLADPEAYEGSELIITASIGDVLARRALYQNRRIEVTGDIAYHGRRSFWTWYLLLADGEDQLRCYTHHYRLSVGRDAGTMMLRAVAGQQPVTVNGILRSDGIDIMEILCDGQLVRPDYKPPVVPSSRGGYL